MSGTTYFDQGWSGTPAAVSSALAAFGYQVNADSTVTLTDPSKQGSVVAVTGYKLLDGVAYVLVRSTSALALPAGITDVGPQTITALSGTFMAGPDVKPTTIRSLDFFDRFEPAEQLAVQTLAETDPQVALGLTNGLAAGWIDLTSPTVKAWLDRCVAGGALTADRETVLLTP